MGALGAFFVAVCVAVTAGAVLGMLLIASCAAA